jgi:hypothetical protein
LIRDVHTSIAAGRDVAGLLDLAVLLHTEAFSWLKYVGAGVDLCSLATLAARQAAERRDHPVTMCLAVWNDVLVMLADGDFEVARAELDSLTVPTSSLGGMELAGVLALGRSWMAAADQRPADAEAALGEAAELAEHTGESNAYWMGFGPTNVGMWRVAVALESGDHEHAVAIGERLDPRVHPNRSRQAAYWIDYGRALMRIRGRRDDAVMALWRAEKLSPARLYRHRLAREVLGELVTRAKHDAIGRELRRMAWRAGLPV